MDQARIIIIAVLSIVWIFVFFKVYFDEHKSKKYTFGTKFIVRVGIFGAISSILYIFIKFPLPFMPPFLEIHFDEVPVFIASFAYGPFTGFCVLLVKTLIKLPFTSSMCVGELCDLIASTAFIIPAALIYKRHRSFKGALVGLGIGTISQLIVAMMANVYVILPFYMNVMEFSKEALLEMCQKANPSVTNLEWSYAFILVLPFNLIKNAAVILVTLPVYKATHRFIDKMQS